jgi:hypothetical protein
MTEFKNPADIIVAVRDIADPMKPLMKVMSKLSDLTDDMVLTDAERADALMIESLGKLHAEEMKVFAARRAMLRQNKTKVYSVIWGQCSPALQSELMGEQEYQTMSTSFDCIWLLETLNLFSAGVDKNSNVYMSTFHTMKSFYTIRQSPTETMETYYHGRFESAVATAILSKGNLFGHDKLSEYEREKGNVTATDNAVKDGYLAIAFLENADPHHFSGLWTQLKNSMLLGHNDYPSNLTSTYDLLCNYKPVGTVRRPDAGPVHVNFVVQTPASDGTPASNTPAPTPGNNGVLSALTFCYNCRRHGHIVRFCPAPRTAGGVQGMQFGITLTQLI